MSAAWRVAACLTVVILAAACSGGSDGGGSSSTSTGGSSSATAGPTTTPGGDPNGLPAGRITFYGADSGDQESASITGDFNGDGVTDVAVGAAFADGPRNDRPDAGEVYLFLGPFAPGSNLDAGAGDSDAIFYGAAAGDELGRSLTAGDFNGDGVDDLVMAPPSVSNQAGAVYVMFGGKWPAQTDFASADPDVRLTGSDPGDFAGFTLASADLDGDHKSDLIVGSMLADGPQNARRDSGEVYVVHGADLIAGSSVPLEQSPNIIYGARAGDRLGEGLATGDVSGDGKPDIIAVATFSAGPDSSRAGAGQTYVISSPAALPLDLATGGAYLEVLGADPGDQLGHSVGAGYTDGDGKADVWLGAVSADGPNNAADLAGEAVLIAGKHAPGTIVDEAGGGTDAIIYGPEAQARLGRSLTVGDLNGDNLADLAISAPNLNGHAGKVFVFFAGPSYPGDTSGADLAYSGLDAGDMLGNEAFGAPSLSAVDVDRDGLGDLLIAAPSGDGPGNNRPDCGEVYLILGTRQLSPAGSRTASP